MSSRAKPRDPLFAVILRLWPKDLSLLRCHPERSRELFGIARFLRDALRPMARRLGHELFRIARFLRDETCFSPFVRARFQPCRRSLLKNSFSFRSRVLRVPAYRA